MDGTVVKSRPALVLLGPPGSGKGTQARMLTTRFGLVQLSTGDLLRGAVAAGTPAGRAAQEVMERGDLVSDEIVVAILSDRMAEADCAGGVILDGFPRTLAQARALDTLLSAQGEEVAAAIDLQVDEDAIVARVAGRFTCGGCGEGYHDSFKPTAVEGVCDDCGGTDMKRRKDDNAETVRARLTAYREATAPLAGYYADAGVLREIDAMGPIDTIAEDLAAIVDDALARR